MILWRQYKEKKCCRCNSKFLLLHLTSRCCWCCCFCRRRRSSSSRRCRRRRRPIPDRRCLPPLPNCLLFHCQPSPQYRYVVVSFTPLLNQRFWPTWFSAYHIGFNNWLLDRFPGKELLSCNDLYFIHWHLNAV